jgi:selenocysteine lyase/cysteine desulfurase
MPTTLVEGGNGVDSLEGEMSREIPERYEAGTLPAPAICGLAEGIDTVEQLGIERIGEHEKSLFRRARERLGNMQQTVLYTPQYEGAVLCFNVQKRGSEEIARLLGEQGICVRGGYHCNALGHRTLGTEDTGAVRVSFGPFNNSGEIDVFCDTLWKIIK